MNATNANLTVIVITEERAECCQTQRNEKNQLKIRILLVELKGDEFSVSL